jgi:dTDP-glucose pyrophosphorylase
MKLRRLCPDGQVGNRQGAMQGVILAAGQGRRLGQAAGEGSKAMVPIAGKPMAARVLEMLAATGIQEYLWVVRPDDHAIRALFSGESYSSFRNTFIVQEQPLGMGHALKLAVPWITGDFVVSACDNLLDPQDLKLIARRWRAPGQASAVLTLLEVTPRMLSRMSAVRLEGRRVLAIVEKPAPGQAPSNIASLPLYWFRREFLPYLEGLKASPRGEFELQDAVQQMIADGGVVEGVMVSERWTLTFPEDIQALEKKFRARDK